MKRLLFVLLAVSLLFVGCSKDDEPKNYAETVYGKWVQTAYRNSSTGSYIGQEDGTYIEFKKDGTFTFFLGSVFNETTIGTYKMTSEMSMELQIEGETSKPTISIYDLEGNDARFQFIFLHTGTYKMERR